MSVAESTEHTGQTGHDGHDGHGAASGAEDHAEHPAHPSDWTYVKIALILGVLTGVEVFTYFESVLEWGQFLMPVLILLMMVKFYLIAAYFMHLKFDPKVLRRTFMVGIVMASAVYLIVLAVFEFFGDWV